MISKCSEPDHQHEELGWQRTVREIKEMAAENQKLVVEAEPTGAPKTSREWTAIRDECVSGGNLTDDCNLVRATHGAPVEVVMQKLSCGCILVPGDAEEILL